MSTTLMQKVDLTASASEIAFTNIAGFTDLMIMANLRSDYGSQDQDGVAIQLNGIATGFSSIDVFTSASASAGNLVDQSSVLATNERVGGLCPSATSTSGVKGSSKILIPSYSESGWLKCIMAEYQLRTTPNGTTTWGRVGTNWDSTVPINSIVLYPADGSAWEAGSVATLYGLQAA